MATDDAHALRERLKDLYRTLRTTAMNREIYGCRLESARSWNFRLELAIAIGTSAAIASWAIWQDGRGEHAWLVISGVATILAIAKPLINFPKQIERYSKLFVGHSDALFDLDRLVQDARADMGLAPDYDERYRDVLDRLQKLVGDDDPRPNKKLVRECYDMINRRYPAESFWLP